MCNVCALSYAICPKSTSTGFKLWARCVVLTSSAPVIRVGAFSPSKLDPTDFPTCINPQRPTRLLGLPNLPAPSSPWRQEREESGMPSPASGAESTKFDVFPQTLLESAKGMFLGPIQGCPRDDTCKGARKQEWSASNMLRVDGQQNPGVSKGNHQIGCVTLTKNSTSYLPLLRPWHQLLCHSLLYLR